jgi:ABC-type phosphate transport system permease subunit
MNGKKIFNDFCKTALPGIITGVIVGLTYINSNFKDYFNDDE